MVEKINKFKTLTFFSGLITLILALALSFCLGYILISWLPSLFEGGDDQLAAAVTLLLLPLLLLIFAFVLFGLVAAVCYFVLGILLLISSFKEDKVFGRRKGFFIFTIVADFILMAILIGLGVFFSVWPFYIVSGAMVLSAVLKIIDLSLYKKRQKNTLVQKNEANKSEEFSTMNSDIETLKQNDDK